MAEDQEERKDLDKETKDEDHEEDEKENDQEDLENGGANRLFENLQHPEEGGTEAEGRRVRTT